MRVVMEGEHSKSVCVESGVPQGTILSPLLFLCHINDLPDSVKSNVRLFVDDCLLYRTIKTQEDHYKLQYDLSALEKWASNWGMRFSAKKCYILSINNRSSHFYSLDNHILQQVSENPYLGLTLSDNLKWGHHIQKISKKANSTMAFLSRNLKSCPEQCKKSAYIALVRSRAQPRERFGRKSLSKLADLPILSWGRSLNVKNIYREIQNLDQNFSLKSWKCCKTSPCLKVLSWPLKISFGLQCSCMGPLLYPGH